MFRFVSSVLRFLLNPGPRYSLRKVIGVLTLSVIVLSGSTVGCYLFYLYAQKIQRVRAATPIRAIIQTGPRYNAIQTSFLAEILDLSVDRPAVVTIGEWKERLLASHIVHSIDVHRLKSDILFVDYTIRTPIAYLGDYTNTALDESGALFPYAPYYSAQNLPEIYLGAFATPNPWGEQVSERHMKVVKEIFQFLPFSEIERIDLSHSENPSAGRREIVVKLKGRKIVRLTPKNYPQQLERYRMLEPHIATEGAVIDMRLPDVAYIQKV